MADNNKKKKVKKYKLLDGDKRRARASLPPLVTILERDTLLYPGGCPCRCSSAARFPPNNRRGRENSRKLTSADAAMRVTAARFTKSPPMKDASQASACSSLPDRPTLSQPVHKHPSTQR